MITIKDNRAEFSAALRRIPGKVRFAAAVALTRTAADARKEVGEQMRRAFQDPTPYTMRAIASTMAKPDALTARVKLREDAPGKGTPWVKALAHHFVGGSRAWTRVEGLLLRKGLMPKGMAAVPGQKALLNSHGNLDRGKLVQMLSVIQAFGEQGYRANATPRTRSRLASRSRSAAGYIRVGGFEYFVSSGRGQMRVGSGSWRDGRVQHLPAGVWRRSGTHGVVVEPVLMFVRKPAYRKSLDMPSIVERTASLVFPEHLSRALGQARW